MPGGRPTKYKKKFHPNSFIELAKSGKCKTQICAMWNISKDTLYEWINTHKEFSDAVRVGMQHLEAYWINLGVAGMTGQARIMQNGQPINVPVNNGMYRWLTQNIFGWSDKIVTQSNEEEAKTRKIVLKMTDD